MRAPVLTAIAISVGLITLLGYFIPVDSTRFGFIINLRTLLVGWAVVLAGIATLVGVFNLFIVHIKRMGDSKTHDPASIFVVAGFLLTLGFGLFLSPGDPNFQRVVTSVQAPVEASLMALLAVTLTLASFRLFQRRRGWMGVVFAISAVFFLLLGSGLLSSLQDAPAISGILGFFQRLPVAGGRGILIGVALGSLTAGLRILLGADRPYSG